MKRDTGVQIADILPELKRLMQQIAQDLEESAN